MTVTTDAMLGGRLALRQPASGHRSGSDAVLLAAAVPAAAGERALELGCGAGAALLCLAARVPGLQLTGLEIEPEAADLARQNAALNKLGERVEIVVGDIAAVAEGSLVDRKFDHVLLNPPYFPRASGTAAPDARRALARVAPVDGLEVWVKAALACLRPGGVVTVIHRAEFLGTLLAKLDRRFGGIVIFPLWPGQRRAAKRAILQGRKGSRAALRLLPGLVLHNADGSYTAAAQAVLRHGEALDLA